MGEQYLSTKLSKIQPWKAVKWWSIPQHGYYLEYAEWKKSVKKEHAILFHSYEKYRIGKSVDKNWTHGFWHLGK
jgi:hypothetical protein